MSPKQLEDLRPNPAIPDYAYVKIRKGVLLRLIEQAALAPDQDEECLNTTLIPKNDKPERS